MTSEPTNDLISPTPPVSAKQAESQTDQTAPASPWEEYLTGKKTPAASFLAKMGKGVGTDPDEMTRDRFAEALVAKPERIDRLISLLHAPVLSGLTIRRIVLELTEAGIRRLSSISFPEPLDAMTFSQAVLSWLNDIPEKPLKAAELHILFLLLHFGRQRQLLDQDTAFSLVDAALTKPSKSRPMQAQPGKRASSLMHVLLAIGPRESLLSSLIAYFDTSKAAADKQNTQVQSQVADIERLTAERASLNATITGLHAEIVTLKEQKTAVETQVTELERQMVNVHDGYKHQIYEMRERMRGILQGQLTRWLQTALEETQVESPWMKAIEERLVNTLKLIEKEIQWLQPSD
jgi:hypothetical protein